MMPDEERRQHLAILKSAQAQLQGQFSDLSLTSATVRHRRHQAALEQKMAETEAEIKVFSKPRVYLLP
jgi:hypothetical protein